MLVNCRFQAARIFQAIHLRMMNHAAVLDALIVAAADDLSIAYEHRTDRNPTGCPAFLCFFDCCREKRIHVGIQAVLCGTDKLAAGAAQITRRINFAVVACREVSFRA